MFSNSYLLAEKERGFYVEGYAMSHEMAFPARLDHHSMGSMPSTSPCAVLLRIFYFGISIPFRILRGEILARDGSVPVPPVDHAFPMAKMEGRASKGDCRSAGLRPYVEPVRNAFDHVAQLAAQ